MSESRICQVCKNEIPSDWSYVCPHCNFELKWLDDEQFVESARWDNLNKNILKDIPEENIKRPERKFYISGLIGSAIPGFFVLVLVFWSLGTLLWIYALPVWLLGGLPAGYIGTKLSTDYSSSSGLIVLTMILGFLFAFIISVAVVFLWL